MITLGPKPEREVDILIGHDENSINGKSDFSISLFAINLKQNYMRIFYLFSFAEEICIIH